MKLALQIYTLRSYLSADRVKDTLRRVRETGYDGVEWFGLMGYAPAQLAKLTEDAGLLMFSVHRSFDDIGSCNTDELDALAAAGVKYLPIGWLPEERLAGGPLFEETVAAIRRYAEEAKKRGMYVMYHNHDFDLKPYGAGTRLDALLAALPEDLFGAEPDTCWLYSGGVDPAEYLRKYCGRSPVVHLKDCVREGGRSGFMPVGHGVLDWDAILPECGGADWLCVEQDEPSGGLDAFECARLSAEFLRKAL